MLHRERIDVPVTVRRHEFDSSPPGHRSSDTGSARLRLEPERRRKPKLLLASVALLVACAALFGVAYARAGHLTPVLAVAKPVAAGSIVSDADLSVVRIATSGHVSAVPVGDADLVVGRRAAVALAPGEILTLAQVTQAAPLAPGEALVGIAAKSSQLPAGGVEPGQTVSAVLTGLPDSPLSSGSTPSGTGGPDPSGATPVGTILATAVTVSAVSPGDAGEDLTIVSLVVPVTQAPGLAAASAAGQVALIAVAP